MAPRARSPPAEAEAAAATGRVVTKGGKQPKLSNTSVGAPLNIFGGSLEVARPPAAAPQFDRGAVYAAVPPHCFERSALRGFAHIAVDGALVAALGYAGTHIQYAPCWAQLALWPAFWYALGCVMTGLWVIAHECGHQAFSPSKAINDTVGWVLHSALLVPYHSWRISHAKHHRNTCSVEHDEVFVPATRSSIAQEMLHETPLGGLWGIFVMLVFGWPAYLIANVAGPAKYAGKANSHFTPGSELFQDDWVLPAKRRAEILTSDWGLLLALGGLGYAARVWGVQAVAAYYVLPYLVVNLNLVLITYLQHTDVHVPHYREGQFTWLRGALSTVDRSYGWLLDAVFHHISDTHVVHHMFHEMPFYHAQEATRAVRAFLGDYYLVDHTPIPAALWRSWKACRFVEDSGDVVYYKDAQAFNAGKPKGEGKKAAAGAARARSNGRGKKAQ